MRVVCTIEYTDGTKIIREFDSVEEAEWFIFNEGDHVKDHEVKSK